MLQPLARGARATIGALVVALKTTSCITIMMRISEPLQMAPSRVLLSSLGGTVCSYVLGALVMSAAEHTRRQLLLPRVLLPPHSQEQPRTAKPQRIERETFGLPLGPTAALQVAQPASSPNWLLCLLLLVHAAPLLAIAVACGLLEAPAVSRLLEIETRPTSANRNETMGDLTSGVALQSWASLCLLVAIGALSVGAVRLLQNSCEGDRLTHFCLQGARAQ